MGRAPCCEKMGLKKGPWTPEEDKILISHIQIHGHSNWRALPKQAGLLRCGKSCRLRWINYLRPDIKRGNFTKEEEDTIINLHEMLGNRWSAIAAKLPGRTDNEIKNVWHTHLKKKLKRKQEDSNNQLQPQLCDPIITSQSETENSQTERPVSNIAAMSPQPSSSEISTLTDNSVATAETANTHYIKQEDINSPEIFPVIDEYFWSESETLDSSSNSMSFDALDVQQLEFGTNFMEFDEGLKIADMDFWYNVFVKSGGVEELLN